MLVREKWTKISDRFLSRNLEGPDFNDRLGTDEIPRTEFEKFTEMWTHQRDDSTFFASHTAHSGGMWPARMNS